MNFEDFKSKIVSDKDFAAKFVGKKPSEVVALAKAEGYNISTADLKLSLSDDDFDAVAGGGFISGLVGKGVESLIVIHPDGRGWFISGNPDAK